jgi:hypothetical protein
MSTVAILPSNFNPAKLTAKPLKVLDNGGKAVNLEFDGRGLWMVQTPVTQLPYGMNIFDKDGKAPKYSVDLSFRDAENDPKVKSFYDFAKAFDERLIELAMANSQAWFKLPSASREVISAFYTPMVKVPVDKEGKPKPYPPTTKIALKQKDGVFMTEFYNPNETDSKGAPRRYEGVPVEELLVRGSRIRAIIRCTGIWIAGSKFGPSWKAEQVSIESLPERLRGFGFVDDGPSPVNRANTGGAAPRPSANRFNQLEEDDEEESAVAAVLPKKASAPTPAEEEEDDEAEVVAPVPVPKPQPKKAAQPKKAGAK